MTNFTNTDSIIDVRDIIARVEELREMAEDESMPIVFDTGSPLTQLEFDELQTLESLLEELKGCGGDEKWQGDWYPITLIRDSYFEDYAQELAQDIGAVNEGAGWPNNCIDWEKAARELQMDYSSVDFGNNTYWYR